MILYGGAPAPARAPAVRMWNEIHFGPGLQAARPSPAVFAPLLSAAGAALIATAAATASPTTTASSAVATSGAGEGQVEACLVPLTLDAGMHVLHPSACLYCDTPDEWLDPDSLHSLCASLLTLWAEGRTAVGLSLHPDPHLALTLRTSCDPPPPPSRMGACVLAAWWGGDIVCPGLAPATFAAATVALLRGCDVCTLHLAHILNQS